MQYLLIQSHILHDCVLVTYHRKRNTSFNQRIEHKRAVNTATQQQIYIPAVDVLYNIVGRIFDSIFQCYQFFVRYKGNHLAPNIQWVCQSVISLIRRMVYQRLCDKIFLIILVFWRF